MSGIEQLGKTCVRSLPTLPITRAGDSFATPVVVPAFPAPAPAALAAFLPAAPSTPAVAPPSVRAFPPGGLSFLPHDLSDSPLHLSSSRPTPAPLSPPDRPAQVHRRQD